MHGEKMLCCAISLGLMLCDSMKTGHSETYDQGTELAKVKWIVTEPMWMSVSSDFFEDGSIYTAHSRNFSREMRYVPAYAPTQRT